MNINYNNIKLEKGNSNIDDNEMSFSDKDLNNKFKNNINQIIKEYNDNMLEHSIKENYFYNLNEEFKNIINEKELKKCKYIIEDNNKVKENNSKISSFEDNSILNNIFEKYKNDLNILSEEKLIL